jgi:hypothetical protein
MLALGGYFLVRDIIDLPLAVLSATACHVGEGVGERVELKSEQMANAATIAAVGIRRGVPQRAIVIAIATAWQESRLENLSGGDRDSIGLFQQRPSQDWGTPEQISDPRYAASEFYAALLKVRGWHQMRVTEAAQSVQRSAHPDAYEQWADRSELLARALSGDLAEAVGCTVSNKPDTRGEVAANALVERLRLDWGSVGPTVAAATVSVAARDDRSGWQYAHWLVAHAPTSGVRRVRYGDHAWNASDGAWTRATADPAPPAPGNTVLAEMYT